VSDLVTPAEAALLAHDQDTAPWQHALVVVLSGSLDRAELAARIAERLDYAPRFRRIVTGWPVAGWVDDANFNLDGHLHDVTLASGQRLETWLAAELRARLSRNHPLWQVALVKGLPGGAQAVVVRVNPAMIDGYDHIHLFQELFEDQPDERLPSSAPSWQPSQTTAPDFAAVMSGLTDPLAAAERAVGGVLGFLESGLRSVTPPPQQELYLAGAEVDFATLSALRERYGCTIHDVVVALATAGIRRWQHDRGVEPSDPLTLVPLAITEPQVLESAIGCRIAPSFDRLPVTTQSPVARLEAIATMTLARRESGLSVPARDLMDLAGFAPATVHAVAAGTISAGRPHTATVVNVPGPDRPRYLGRARVRQIFAATTPTDAEEITVTINSYQGRVSLTAAAIAPLPSWTTAIIAELAALGA
jgi:WS/DGAT/MGAT family acyltransferase